MATRRRAAYFFVQALLAAALFSPDKVVAQGGNGPRASLQGSIQGKVTFLDHGKSSPIPGVTVRLGATKGGAPPSSTTTDADGNYLFADLPENTYEVELSHDSFQTQTDTVVLGKGAVVVRNYSLTLGSLSQTVQVLAGASPIAAENVTTTTTVTSQQILALPIAQQLSQLPCP
jgi:hypothetical protein